MKIFLLFLNLQNQDSYADIDNLIYEMKKKHLEIIFIYVIYFHSLVLSALDIIMSLIFS